MKIHINDIEFLFGGFNVPKIKNLTDEQLSQIEDEIPDISWANIEEMGFLTVGFRRKYTAKENQKETILRILNSIIIPK